MANEENVLSKTRVKGVLDELMETEEGREMAQKIRTKLKDLNSQYEGLYNDDRQKFLDNFKEKFADTMENMKDALKIKMGEKVDGEFKIEGDDVVPAPDYFPKYLLFLLAVGFVVLVFGFFGYKLYKSIMEKEMKREKKTRKQLKEEKKTQSPPGSPRSKKEN